MINRPDIASLQHKLAVPGGFSLVYREFAPGQQASRGDLLLVHGPASSGLQFEQEAIRFARQGYRVLVPDLRGHGLSAVPSGPIRPADFTISTMAQDVLAMLDHAGARDVHWVGNSLGGILALFLLGTPERDRLRSLALFGTCFSMRLPPQVSGVLRAAFLPGSPTTAWITARTTTASRIGRKSIETAINQFDIGAGAAIAANVRNYDFVDNARRYDRPLLLLRGGRDHAVNLGLRGDIGKFANRPNFRRVDLPKGGHCANFDMPEAFCHALEQHWDRATPAMLVPVAGEAS